MRARYLSILLSVPFLIACESASESRLEAGPKHGEEFGSSDELVSKERLYALEERLAKWQKDWGLQAENAIGSIRRSLGTASHDGSAWEQAEDLYRSTVHRLSQTYDEVLRAHPELRQPLDALQRYSEDSKEYQAAKKVLSEKLPQLLGPAWEREMRNLNAELEKLGIRSKE